MYMGKSMTGNDSAVKACKFEFCYFKKQSISKCLKLNKKWVKSDFR